MTAPAPTAVAGRIVTLDVVRGIAVMGILAMNIVAFAMPEAAYSNPAAFGWHSHADFVAWYVQALFFDGKMRGLFSMLFGASLLLVVERAEAKGEDAAQVHFRRMAWLFVFGMLHLLLFWDGDILNHYALIGAVAFAFRKLPAHKLVVIAGLLLACEFALVASTIAGMRATIADAQAGHATPDLLRALVAYRSSFGIPSAADIAHQVATHRSGFATIFAARFHDAIAAPGQALGFLGAETLAYMLIGMAGLRSGLLSGDWSRKTYLVAAAAAFALGLPITFLLARITEQSGFAMPVVAAQSLLWSQAPRLILMLGWACLVAWFASYPSIMRHCVAAAGRVAFSNYLGTTIVCTTLFYGYGFGLYGRLTRAELGWVVLAICAAMLVWSPLWLARYRFGPLEWLWRSLARGRLQPMRC